MTKEILSFLIALPAVLWAITFHEFSHAFVDYKLGDPTPKLQGRLTLNPIAHLDIIGFLALLLVHFGWAKPVMINPMNYKKVSPELGNMLVAIAGPFANFLSAFLSVILIKLIPFPSLPMGISQPVFLMLEYSVYINVGFAIFNLLPIPPLDGSKVVGFFLPRNLNMELQRLEPYGMIVLILLLISPVIDWVLVPIVNAIVNSMFWI